MRRDRYFGLNDVNITLANGKTGPSLTSPVPIPAAAAHRLGDDPFAKTVLTGPFNYTTDASLFKVFPVAKEYDLRFNMDVFNLLNMPGLQRPERIRRRGKP